MSLRCLVKDVPLDDTIARANLNIIYIDRVKLGRLLSVTIMHELSGHWSLYISYGWCDHCVINLNLIHYEIAIYIRVTNMMHVVILLDTNLHW